MGTKAGCTYVSGLIPVVYMYIVYTCNLTLQKTRDGGCCPPLVGKAEFANVSLPTVLINLVDIHSRLGYYIADVGCSILVHGFESRSLAYCGCTVVN